MSRKLYVALSAATLLAGVVAAAAVVIGPVCPDGHRGDFLMVGKLLLPRCAP